MCGRLHSRQVLVGAPEQPAACSGRFPPAANRRSVPIANEHHLVLTVGHVLDRRHDLASIRRLTDQIYARQMTHAGRSKPLRTAALRALATGVPITLCDRRRDRTIISRLPGLPSKQTACCPLTGVQRTHRPTAWPAGGLQPYRLTVTPRSMPWLKIARWAVALVIAAAVAVAVLYLLLWGGPDVLARHDVGNVTGSLRALRLEQARDAARGRLLTLGAGIFAAGALIYTARNFPWPGKAR